MVLTEISFGNQPMERMIIERKHFLDELDFTTQARSLILCHDYARAVQLLTQLAEVAEKEGRVEGLIEVLILQSIALHESGEEDQAITTLTSSLVLAEPEGYQRIVLDEGKLFLRLLRCLNAPNITPPLQGFVKRLLEASRLPNML